MMKSLYIASMERGSGKTTIAIALISELVRRNIKVVPFKPFMFNISTVKDESINVLLELSRCNEKLDNICPIRIEGYSQYIESIHKLSSNDILNIVKSKCNYLKQNYEVVIGVGYKSLTHKILGKVFEIDIVKEIESSVLIVCRPTSEDSIGDVIAAIDLSRSKNIDIVGVIFNNVKPWIKPLVNEWVKLLEDESIEVLGIIDEDLSLLNPTIKELVEELNGKVITHEDKLNTTYEHILVGAMTPDAALRYMRSIPNKIVITGGDRADMIMLALETDTKAIILTGGIMPSPRVIARAEERGIPIVIVNYDTYTTVSRILSASGKIRIGDKRIDIIIEKIPRYINIDKIIEKLKV